VWWRARPAAGAHGYGVRAVPLAVLLAWAGVARAQEPPPVEPPNAAGLETRCAEAAHELWRGNAPLAESLARQALAASGDERGQLAAGGPLRHPLARCHAIAGRAILARRSREPAVHAAAERELRRAWQLEPSADLLDDLVASHWLGTGTFPLPIAPHDRESASPAERAALAPHRSPSARAVTLRSAATPGGATWSLVEIQPRAMERGVTLVAVACDARSRCAAGELASAASGAALRVASVGYVATRRGFALVAELDHAIAWSGASSAPAATWSGSAVYVRWVGEGRIDGWNLLTRSRAERWDRAAAGSMRPFPLDVRVLWARARVAITPVDARSRTALASVSTLARDPTAIGCDEVCWLGALRPPTAP
jgi:hypothetical protein